MSIYQIIYMDAVPDRAIIDEAVKLIKKRKMNNLSGFVNGVLRNVSRQKEEIEYPKENDENFLSVIYSFPQWLISLLINQYNYETVKQICEQSLKKPSLCVRLNTLKCNEKKLVTSLKKENVSIEKGHFFSYAYYLDNFGDLRQLEAFNKGYFQVQDESSMFIGEIANPKEKDTILDVCSAPGGKATHLAQLMNNNGKIYARDISEKKTNKIKENVIRLGITNVDISIEDATVFNSEFENKFDIVLTDVPCSGLGIVQKKPDIKYNISEEGIKSLIEIQRKILETSSRYVKKGGCLIYSTCTINRQENEENIEWFIKHNENYKSVLIDFNCNNAFYSEKNKNYLQLLPINNQSDGFFIAKLQRMS